MGDIELVTAADVRLMQGLAQRVVAVRPDLVNADASFGELAWIWGKGHAAQGRGWRRRLWFAGDELVAWCWAHAPHQFRRSDGSVGNVAHAAASFQVHPGHAGLLDEVIAQIAPVTLGAGRPLLPRRLALKLEETERNGDFVAARYSVVGPGAWEA